MHWRALSLSALARGFDQATERESDVIDKQRVNLF
jgi:hypothetical protein